MKEFGGIVGFLFVANCDKEFGGIMDLFFVCGRELFKRIWWHCGFFVLKNCGKEFGDVVDLLFWQIVGENLVTLLWFWFCLWQGIAQKNLATLWIFCFSNLWERIWWHYCGFVFALANYIKKFGDVVALFLFVADNCVKKNW